MTVTQKMENCTPISHTAEVGVTIIDQNQISDKKNIRLRLDLLLLRTS